MQNARQMKLLERSSSQKPLDGSFGNLFWRKQLDGTSNKNYRNETTRKNHLDSWSKQHKRTEPQECTNILQHQSGRTVFSSCLGSRSLEVRHPRGFKLSSRNTGEPARERNNLQDRKQEDGTARTNIQTSERLRQSLHGHLGKPRP